MDGALALQAQQGVTPGNTKKYIYVLFLFTSVSIEIRKVYQKWHTNTSNVPVTAGTAWCNPRKHQKIYICFVSLYQCFYRNKKSISKDILFLFL